MFELATLLVLRHEIQQDLEHSHVAPFALALVALLPRRLPVGRDKGALQSAGGGDNGFASVGREPDHAVDQPVEFDQDVRLRGVEVGMNGPG